MDNYKIQITAQAKADLRAAYTYIKKDLKEPAIADKFLISIEQSVESLAAMPERCGLVHDERLAIKGYRTLVVRHHMIFYTIDEQNSTIIIARILYARRDWLNIL
jgi:addiction module RelE/StbE family toxin